jgi:uncharacterized protein (TIGR00255 family)
MPVYSMTGFASAHYNKANTPTETEVKTSSAARLGMEIRSVNSRFLDLTFKLPDELRAFEPALRELLTQHLKRGKVEVRAFMESSQSTPVADPSVRLLQRLNAVQDQIKAWLPEAKPLSVADVLRLAGNEHAPSQDVAQQIMELASQVVNDLREARAREGERLAAMLLERIAQIQALATQAVPLVPQLVAQQRLRFMERWNEAMALTDGRTPPDAAQDRALTEATAFAIRIDVAEEISRLQSHLDELQRLISKGGDIGKRMDFLIQELHREANTMGSKSAALELTHISVDMKVLIEQMREQVQNIE